MSKYFYSGEKYHLIYTDKDGKFHNEEKEFGCFAEAEIYLVDIGAKDWEIGIPDNHLKHITK